MGIVDYTAVVRKLLSQAFSEILGLAPPSVQADDLLLAQALARYDFWNPRHSESKQESRCYDKESLGSQILGVHGSVAAPRSRSLDAM